MTVRRRISLLVAGAGFVASLVFSIAVFFELIEQPFEILDMELEMEAQRALRTIVAREEEPGKTHPDPAANEIYSFWLKIVEQDSGKLLHQSGLTHIVSLPLLAPGTSTTIRVAIPTGLLSQGKSSSRKTPFRIKSFAFGLKGKDFNVQIARPIEKLQEEIWELVFSLIAGLVLSSLVLVAISHFIAGKILKPIGKMKDMAKDISEKNLDQRLPAGSEQDEFNELARTINRMLDRLQHSFDNQRNFLFDTSHELKTPLTTMRLAIDEVCTNDIENLPDSTRENLLRLNAQVRRMDRLVKDLLKLSALEMSDSIEQRPLSVASIITPLVDEYRFIAEAQHIHVDCRLPESCTVLGDVVKLTRAFSNILDNAIRYNSEDGFITIEGDHTDGRVSISVTNSGPGITEEDIDKVFNQFFRVEKSRSLEHGGSGLGLAIVKRIIMLHGGTVKMESRPGEWTRVWVTLPK